MYNFLVEHGSAWQLGALPKPLEREYPERIGYYLWHFPALSETFIQREVRALQRAGLSVQVFADAVEDVEVLDEQAASLIPETHYLLPRDSKRLAKFKRHFFWQHPLRYLNLFIYTMLHRYSSQKNFKQDVHIFEQAVYLAGTLREQQIQHLHSPWASLSAFIALIASRLTGIPYSVQARASADLYRKTSRYALTEKFENAKFIVTNAQVNQDFIRLCLRQNSRVPIATIYEGLDLAEFTPRHKPKPLGEPIQILSVARLIEEKGLVYLLKALRLLKTGGCSFQCEIIGAPVEPEYASYYTELLALWEKLELQDSVCFRGALPFEQVLKKYECADIFVLPCVMAKNGGRDVTPNALMEAMAMELPVISSNMSGIPEIVEHSVSGLMLPPKNERALAQALMELIADPALRYKLGRNARKRVEERFDIRKNVLQYLALFQGQMG